MSLIRSWLRKAAEEPEVVAPPTSSLQSQDIWLMHQEMPKGLDQKSTDWGGIAIYTDAIVLRVGDSIIVVSKDGITIDSPDLTLKPT